MRILAIDPGYDRLGIAVLEKQPKRKEILLYSSCLQTDRKRNHSDRLLAIVNAIKGTIEEWHPDACAIENLFFTTNQKTVMRVAEARGAIITEAARAGLHIYEYTPLQIKIAVTGYGRSDKRQITEMVKRLIVLNDKKRFDDEYDAIAVGLTCLASVKSDFK